MPDSSPSENKIHKYRIYCKVMIALGVMLVVSVIMQGITRKSLFGWLASVCPLISKISQFCLRITSKDAILKTAETIGFGSILIAWIYAALDKTDLGFRYGDLLEELYPKYHWLVLEHLLAILACVWLAKVPLLANAALALLITLMGCWLQWYALKHIVLSENDRRRVALDRWKRLNKQKAGLGNDSLLINLCNMAGVIPMDTDCYCEEMRKAFSESLLVWVEKSWSNNLLEQRNLFLDTTKIWDTLLRARPADERRLLVAGILKNCKDSPHLNIVSTGFILWLYHDYLELYAADQNLTTEEILSGIANHLNALEVRDFFQQETRITFYWNTVFTLIVWMHFLYGNIGLHSDLFLLTPSGYGADALMEDKDQYVFSAAIQAIFSQEDWKEYFDRAYWQVFAP